MVRFTVVAVLLVTIISVASGQEEEDGPKINIPGLGAVKGHAKWESTLKKRQIYAFRNLPYGKSPTGELRFKKSVRAEPWKNTIDAIRFGYYCLQSGVPAGRSTKEAKDNACPCEHKTTAATEFWQYVHSFDKYVPEELQPLSRHNPEDPEDCLHLQVYTPTLDKTAKLPVMVFYHGGAYLGGSSLIYWPHHLLDYDVLLVVVNYRLGPLGYMSMQDDIVPGNGGLFDQVNSLEWVRDYIHLFGGDKDQVTVFGESAGAASVSYLAIYQGAKNIKLFNRIIAESGSAITDWAIDRYPVYNAKGIAAYAGCNEEGWTDAQISECLITVDPCLLTQAYECNWKPDEMARGKTGFGGCSPVVQTNTGTEQYIDKPPMEYWLDPNFDTVPGFYGANKHEGTYVMALVYKEYLQANGLLDDQDFMRYEGISVFLDLFEIEDASYLVHDALEYEYVGVERLGNITAMTPGMIDFSGSVFLKASSFQNMIHHSKKPGGKDHSYWYAFNYFGRFTLWPFVGGYFGVPFPGGVTHANDLQYVFRIPGLYNIQTDSERKKAREMSKIWYNYAKYGELTPAEHPVEDVPDWPAYNEELDEYVRFDDINIKLKNYPIEYTIAKDENFSVCEDLETCDN